MSLLPFFLACQSSSPPQDSKDEILLNQNLEVKSESEVKQILELNCSKLKTICRSYKGYPYVWGGESHDEGGFDCSGFIYSIFKKINKPIPRSTSRKYWLLFASESVPWLTAKCGYLVWWSFARPYGHIGIMIDSPNFWQSGSSTGPVQKSFRKGGYWDKPFVGAKQTYIFK